MEIKVKSIIVVLLADVNYDIGSPLNSAMIVRSQQLRTSNVRSLLPTAVFVVF
jgi:hypothetical protein